MQQLAKLSLCVMALVGLMVFSQGCSNSEPKKSVPESTSAEKGESPHNEMSHNEMPHNETSHNETSHNEASHNEASHNEADHEGHGHEEKGHDESTHTDHAENAKYKEVMVAFPGHKYAMEIIDEKETTGLVTAFLTNAHFEPVEVKADEVRLNFVIDGSPKSFILKRVPQESGKPATFTLTDKQLATLNCEGWQGKAIATVEINGVPFTSDLIKH
ncbi:MAG: hypothetical protein PHQ75_08650 [Thermoguttaceae bacterium]|nr:hypothetical protein [Thermoguttaceae bacterium]